MRLGRFLLVLALAFGSLNAHCASATIISPVPTHHIGTTHGTHHPSGAHVGDACIGCAMPVRLSFPTPLEAMTQTSPAVALQPVLTTRATALDPPPPRPIA